MAVERIKQIHYIYLLATMFLVGCATQKTSTIVSYDYDKKHNQTNYMIFPYGSVSIPNQWDKTYYNTVSKQQFFKNEEGIIIAIAFAPSNKYEFNADNSQKGFDFVKAFYEWDSQYFVTTYGLKQEIIEENETNNYIIWRLYGEAEGSHWDTYFLFGDKGGVANNYSIMATDKWTVEQKLEFLRGMYD
jgi:hypothetical protein